MGIYLDPGSYGQGHLYKHGCWELFLFVSGLAVGLGIQETLHKEVSYRDACVEKPFRYYVRQRPA